MCLADLGDMGHYLLKAWTNLFLDGKYHLSAPRRVPIICFCAKSTCWEKLRYHRWSQHLTVWGTKAKGADGTGLPTHSLFHLQSAVSSLA